MPPTEPHPSLARRFYEAAIDVVRGGRGYTQQERADLETLRAQLELRLASDELTEPFAQALTSELESVEHALSPWWRSPWRDLSFEAIHNGWRSRLQMLALLSFLAVALWIAHRLRKRPEVARPVPALALQTPESQPEPEPQMGPDRLFTVDMREIEIPPALSGQVKTTIVRNSRRRVPGVRINGRDDRTYPLNTQIRRRYFSILLRNPGESILHSEIMNELGATYSTWAAVWSEGKSKRPLEIVTDGVIGEGTSKGHVRLDLDA